MFIKFIFCIYFIDCCCYNNIYYYIVHVNINFLESKNNVYTKKKYIIYIMNTTFDFTIEDSDYVYSISSNTELHIKRINHSVAILYFTDATGNKISIPGGIVVYTTDYQNTQKKIIVNQVNKSYVLCWTDNYIIKLNENVILNINNQRKWSIQQNML